MAMPLRWKQTDPIDRAINDLDQQIATVQRQMREAASGPARAPGIRPMDATAGGRTSASVITFVGLVKGMLAPPKRELRTSDRVRQDLFDVNAEPLKELEAEPIAFAKKPEPDLFAHPSSSGRPAAAGTVALETAQVVPPQEKLAHYLGAGSIRSYKPLKRVQRQTRNRFFMWLGLSFFALWIIWFVIR
jgi:hypothetical protein